MVKFSEEEYAELLKNQENATPAKRKYKLAKPRMYKERECLTCLTLFPPATASSRYCSPKCKATAKLKHARARKRGERGKTGATRGTLPPLDDGEGTLTQCPACHGTYARPEGDGSVKPEKRNVTNGTGGAPGTSTNVVGGVAFDTFRCVCGHKWDRYK